MIAVEPPINTPNTSGVTISALPDFISFSPDRASGTSLTHKIAQGCFMVEPAYYIPKRVSAPVIEEKRDIMCLYYPVESGIVDGLIFRSIFCYSLQ